MAFFSERNGYVKVSDVLIKGDVTEDVSNAICSSFDGVCDILDAEGDYANNLDACSREFEKYIWTHFLGRRRSQYLRSEYGCEENLEGYITSPKTRWFKKLDLIEFALEALKERSTAAHDFFVKDLNWQFMRLGFGYTIVADQVVERMSEVEMKAVEEAVNNSHSAIKDHFTRALELYSQRPEGDYVNSIKESISAVECVCRERTDANTLGDALKALEKQGIILHPRMKAAFEQMYAYTNQPDTGIRHALMDKEGTYTPGVEEAQFFLVACCAFVNYLNEKYT